MAKVDLIFFLAGATERLQAQSGSSGGEVRWMQLKISEISVAAEVENEMETRTSRNSGDEISVNRLYIAPTVGLGLEGSLYHPNLLQMEIDSEAGYGWQELNISGPSGASFTGSRKEQSLLQRYDGRFSILQQKPYATTLFASKGHNLRNIDFFDRITVDSDAYGGSTGYRLGPVPFTISVAHREQEEAGFRRNLTTTDNTLDLRASNRRSSGNTTLTYALNQFTRDQELVPSQDGLSQSINVFDSEVLGKKERLGLTSSIFYNRLKNSGQHSESFTGHEHAVFKHSKSLQSDFSYNYDSRSSGGVDSSGHQGRAQLRHQLYESLTSVVDIDVQTTDSTGRGTSFSSKRPGVGVNENYRKRLGNWGHLNLGYGWRFSREKREATGRFQQILNERHTLTDGVITFLAQPQVDRQTIRVSNPAGTTIYQELLDYLVVEQGSLTEIKRAPGSNIPNGATVSVDYQVAFSPSTSFATTAQNAQVRLTLFDIFGLYARLNLVDHKGGDTSVQLQEIADKVAGVDVTWRWLHAGVEYEIFDSNLAPYKSLRLFETLTFEPTEGSILSLDFGQSQQSFPDSGVTQRTFHAIGRFKWRIAYFLNYDLEGGVRITKGPGLDQQLATVRTGLEYAYGKLTANIGYDFQDDTYLGELRQRHFMFLRVKRRF